MKDVLFLARKDLLVQFRSKEMFIFMFILGMLVILIFSFAFGPFFKSPKELAASVLWVAFAFAGVIGLDRSFSAERASGGLEAVRLSGVSPSSIYLSKTLSNIIFQLLTAVVITPVTMILFDILDVSLLPALFLIILLGVIGFSAVGTILSAMSTSTSLGESLLSIILFPLIVPVVIAAVKATKILFEKGTIAGGMDWMRVLIVYGIVFLVVSYLVFDYVIEV